MATKVALFANTEWYLYNFRLPLARRLRELGYEVLLLSPDGPYGQKLLQAGFRWRPVPLVRRSLNPVQELIFLIRLTRLIRAERLQLIHNFTIKCAVYGSLAAIIAGVPARVNAIAGLGYVFIGRDVRARLLRPIVRLLIQLALRGRRVRVVLQNEDDVRLFEDLRLVAPRQIRLIRGSGVDCSRFTPPVSRDPGPLRVLLPARLLKDKGVVEFVDAARLLRAGGRPIRFLLAGLPDEGNPASLDQAYLQACADEGVVEWLGHVEDMPALMAQVDVVALPSYREGLPKSLVEAGACERALVTTDVPGCREVVTDGVDGLLVPVRAVEPLAQAIATLDDDPFLRARLGQAARAKAVNSLDQEIVLKQTVGVYREILGAAAPA